ncbi:glycogen debranching enzyme GlgX [Nocardioides mangrovicus]|uniref:Glycogen debranching enzyme GlgX n=1 Tax=Nocardioides mangrovicus TaxID=2478913 RepID=A0A3L8P8L6_9ACTN|nr:glycogen debranching protein GlgX [Nocardioides mangrovicus]RLV51079.1 glycogen debranching enzyme GlgX [Nocardioides mangrovicus]
MSPGQWASDGERAMTWPGRSWPFGATWSPEATNFVVHSPGATGVWVCLFDEHDAETRYPLTEHTLGSWHGAIPGVAIGQRYGIRADGPWDPAAGLLFDPDKLLLDPYARAVSGRFEPQHVTSTVRDGTDSAPYVGRSVVTHDGFDWGEDRPMRRLWRDTVVYELHVKGFTQTHPDVPEDLRGTYAGLATPAVLDYLVDLGVTAVELLPVHQYVSEPRLAAQGRSNYWGYNSIGFLAPHAAYSASGDRGEQITEFQSMVKAMHAAGLEVILDVVYNHTAEGELGGPTLSFRGYDDLGFYQRASTRHGGTDPSRYWDVTGCGNTVAADQPHPLRLILDSLRYWVTEMHVDGFRFDLMPAIARTGHTVDMRCHLLTTIAQDPVLRQVKLIAEPWDASPEGYQVGEFPPPWAEWNDQYRDTVRDFWRTASDGTRTLATRLAGSSDLYADDGRAPYNSVNLVTSHDGFTLRDLVSYDHKHNEDNGEDNRDGADHNHSWNCGVEGETDDADVQALRHRQAANLMATLCLSNGVPMITAGDERGRTQRGNNNAYSQDNEVSWLDWQDQEWLDLHAVTRAALQIRRTHPALRQRHWFEGRPTVPGGPKDLAWVHPDGREMRTEDWEDPGQHVLGMFVSGSPLRYPGPHGEQQRDSSFLLWLNGSAHERHVLPPPNEWVQQATVALSTDPEVAVGALVGAGATLRLAARSLVLLQQAPGP